ncbi:MAG: TetR/AcrR family transcriptional regulator [Deltaproteobacteria bacterium]|nr:MAG: TetR/AcrR family transcriptional regulator [Deltaproteobacteria bacterium]TMQ26005.1 MAG: TetR/AcrR family transcriptional regulator [Deltaproteobacteria bacterium]
MPRRPDLARRAQLARAAFDVLRARGMQISMRELADALGIKRPTLYFYFPDVGAVFETVLEQMSQALTEAVAARVREQAHPIDRLRAVIDGTLGFHRERPQLIAGLLQLWALGGRDLSAVLDRERRGVLAARDALVDDLRAGIARKEVRPCDPERVVDVVLAFVEGTIVHHVLGIARSDDASDELVRRVLEPLRAQRRRKRARP